MTCFTLKCQKNFESGVLAMGRPGYRKQQYFFPRLIKKKKGKNMLEERLIGANFWEKNAINHIQMSNSMGTPTARFNIRRIKYFMILRGSVPTW